MAISEGQVLFKVSRPLFWAAAPSVWFSGVVHSGSYTLSVQAVLFVIALSFPTCLITFGVNDVYDYDSDVQNRRKNNQWMDGTALRPSNHKFVLLSAKVSTAFVILLALPASIRSPQLLGYTVSFLSLVWIYSSPPFRLKDRPILDSLSNGVICWLFWACGYTFSGDMSLVFNAEPASRNGWVVLLYASALHSLGAMVDARADASAKYRTIATVLGERFAASFSMICFFLSTFMVDPWSDVSIATFAGVFTSLLLMIAPHNIVSPLTRLALLGSSLGSMLWVVKAMSKIYMGQDTTRGW